ncbi:unnamed protein product [Schistosoma turkestanicum]|nr:unnamed protein product [Schistosoma turkestanicum]
MAVDRCLYIGNINSRITTDILYELFLQAGPLEDVTVKDTFAFVTFEDEESVPYACSLFEGVTLYGTELIIRPRQNSKFQDLKIRSVPPYAHQYYRPTVDSSGSGSPYRSHFSESTDYIHHRSHRCDSFSSFTPPIDNRYRDYRREYDHYSRSEHNLHPLPPYGLPPYGWPYSPPVPLENRSYERRRPNGFTRHPSSASPASYRDRSPPSRYSSSRHESFYNNRGFCVGILDIDFCGPSIPRILGLENSKIHSCAEGWLPVYADGHTKRFSVVSIGFLLDNADSAVIWRGPRKGSMVGEFLNSVCWGNLDYLIIDTPPGTSDEHITVFEHLQKSTSDVDVGIIIVSTPQRVSLCDVRRELGFCVKTNIKVIGLIENMSGYKCPNCTQCTNVFSHGGAEALAIEKNVQFLGRLPIDPALTIACDRAGDFQSKIYTSENTKLLTEKILSVLSV